MACEILVWAAQRGKAGRGSYPYKTSLVHESLSERLIGIDEHSLEACCNYQKRQRAGVVPGANRFVYLEATPKARSTIPVLTMHWDLDAQPFDMSVRVGLFWHDDNSELLLAGAGFRFESPEGVGGGSHDYFHAQPIMAFTKDDAPLPGLRGEIPTDFPAIPLPAKGPTTLLLCVLVAMLGGAVLPAMRGELPGIEPFIEALEVG